MVWAWPVLLACVSNGDSRLQVTVSTIAGSRHAGPIRQRVEDWQRKLRLFADTLDKWLICQRNWLYVVIVWLTGFTATRGYLLSLPIPPHLPHGQVPGVHLQRA